MYDEIFDAVHESKEWLDGYYTHFQALRDIESYIKTISKENLRVKCFQNDEFQVENNIFETFFLILTKKIIKNQDIIGFFAVIFECIRRICNSIDENIDLESKKSIEITDFTDGILLNSITSLLFYENIILNCAHDYYYEGLIVKEECDKTSNVIFAALKKFLTAQNDEEIFDGNNYPSVNECINKHHVNRSSGFFHSFLIVLHQTGQASDKDVENYYPIFKNFGICFSMLDDILDFKEDIACSNYNLLISLILKNEDYDFYELKNNYNSMDPHIMVLYEKYADRVYQMADSYFFKARSMVMRKIPETNEGELDIIQQYYIKILEKIQNITDFSFR